MLIKTAGKAAPDSMRSILSILFGASIWGISWYPYRLLAAWGFGGLLTFACTGVSAAIIALAVFRRDLLDFRFSWILLAIGLSAGMTNLGFVWGTVNGSVMRVLLLFYLAPVWTAVFSRIWLGERISISGFFLLLVALGGAGLMLWTPELGLPSPRGSAEWAGVLAGMGFALNNVLSRKCADLYPAMRPQLRTVAVFMGTAVLGLPAMFLMQDTGLQVPSGNGFALLVLTIGWSAILVFNNSVVQFGLQRLPANLTSMLMLFEIVVATASAWWLANESLTAQEAIGGICIIASGGLSALSYRKSG